MTNVRAPMLRDQAVAGRAIGSEFLPRRRAIFAAAVFLLATVVAAYWFGKSRFTSNPRTTGLTVNPKFLDLGDVAVTSRLQFELPVRNDTTQDIVVLGVERSCACTSVHPADLRVPAGQIANLRLTIDLRPKDNQSLGLKSWPFSVSLAPRIKGGFAKAPIWELHGRVLNSLLLTPTLADFRDGIIRGAPPPKVNLTVTPTVEIDELEAACNPSLASAVVRRVDAKRFEVEITPADSINTGSLDADVVLTGKRDGTVIATVSVPVRGIVHEDVLVTPSVVLLGARTTVDALEETLILTSRTGRPFALDDVQIENGRCVEITRQSESPTRIVLRVACDRSCVGRDFLTTQLHLKLSQGDSHFEQRVRIIVQALATGK